MAKEKKSKFKYKKRSASQWNAAMNAQTSMYATLFTKDVVEFRPKAGKYRVRICPPGWEDAESFAYEMMIHQNVGANRESFLCLKHHRNEACAACEEHIQAQKNGDTEAAKSIRAGSRFGAYFIVRGEDGDQLVAWPIPWTMFRKIGELCKDEETGEIIEIDHPEEGFDILFTVVKKGVYNEYEKVRLAKSSSPLHEDQAQMDEWLEQISEKPIPDILNFYEPDHLRGVLVGAAESGAADDDDDAPKTRKAAKAKAKSKDKAKPADDDDDDDDDVIARVKNKAKAKAAPVDDDEDDDEDEPTPKAKGKARAKPADDEDDEDEDDEFASPSPKRTTKAKAKAKPVDEDEDDEDEEDEPPKKKAKAAREPAPKKKAARKAKAAPVDDDDDDDIPF